MFINEYVLASVVLVLHLDQGACQICTKNVFVDKTYQEPYIFTYTERYNGNCWFRSCTKTRIRSVTKYRTVKKTVEEKVKECCPGYVREEDYKNLNVYNDGIMCSPICMPACVNGYCSNPGECSCYDGYKASILESHTCSPICSEPCDNGICIAPDTCQCSFGYSLANKTCAPICTEPCVNARCILPDTCACNQGYRKSENNNCEPYCSKGCTNGFCIGPENCQCNEGHIKDSRDDSCIPVCKQDCGNGTCLSPDVCVCDQGFEIKNETCEPFCTDCLNGKCIAPEVCKCDPGYQPVNEYCEPVCNECEHGKCIAPDTCKCDEGYTKVEDGKCEPICNGCEGVCVGPFNCSCNLPLVARNENIEGQSCNCFVNCSDSEILCDRTVCVNDVPTVEKSMIDDGNKKINYYEDYNNYEEYSHRTESVDTTLYTSTFIDWTLESLDTKQTKSDLVDTNYTSANKHVTKISNRLSNLWLYVGMAALTLIVIILIIIVVFKRKALSTYFSGGSYVVEDGSKSHNDCRPSTSFDMRFSSIEKSAKQRDQATHIKYNYVNNKMTYGVRNKIVH